MFVMNNRGISHPKVVVTLEQTFNRVLRVTKEEGLTGKLVARTGAPFYPYHNSRLCQDL